MNWLSQLVGGLEMDPKQLGLLITVRTAEQEGVEPFGEHLAHIRAARVISSEAIPGSRNQKVVVDAGPYGRRTLVCGAPNCKPGIITAYVPPGTSLPGGQRIETITIDGVSSEGMLASGAELRINRDASAILELSVDPGAAIPGCLPDHIIDIDNKSLTHRPDLWGHFGMAREVAAILGKNLTDPVNQLLLPPEGNAALVLSIEDYALCPRYSALVFENVTVQPSPLWLQYRLEGIGLNPINNIVDVTNYVMAELAQPMHAFDHDTLRGGAIIVRLARPGESIAALNGETYALDRQSLVIADAEGAVAIAGVIGGLATGVTPQTTRIVLESANFHPGHVRKTAARLKCRTDASMRFEKAQDPNNTTRGLARAIELMREVSPGIRLVGGVIDNRGPQKPPPVIDLPLDWLERKLGRQVGRDEARRILESLGFGTDEAAPGRLRVTVPSWRATRDISIKDDLAEEIGRMLGYESIVPIPPLLPAEPPPANPERDYMHQLRRQAAAQGFTEVYSYSFVNEEQVRELGMDPAEHIRVVNPIASDQGLLRTSLLPGMIRAVRGNSRHLDEFRFFEIGYEIHRTGSGLPDEHAHLVACLYSRHGDGAAGLFEIKRLAECILSGAETLPAAARQFEHSHRCYTVHWRGAEVGRISELHPKLVEGRAAFLDLNIDRIRQIGDQPRIYVPLSRFPSSAFDLSVVVGMRELVDSIGKRLAHHAGDYLRSIEFVRQYAGAPLPADRKSVSFRVTIGTPDRTLSAGEIAQVRSRMIAALRGEGYELRI